MLYQLSYTPAWAAVPLIRCTAERKRRAGPLVLSCLRTMHAPAPPLIPPEMLLLAYRSGIFPMADSRDDPEVYWVEPRQRAIMPLDGFHCSRSLAKVLRADRFRVTWMAISRP